jgi:diguanylate cyclase (GGDEF)-like protein
MTTEAEQPTILIVDDDALLQQATCLALEDAGYQTLTAANGLDALRLVHAHRPDLVLLDVTLPEMDGFEVLQRIKADPERATTYVIIVSGSRIDTDSQVQGLELGADGYLTRPIANRELVARVQSMLRIKAAEDALRLKEQQMRDLIASNIDGMLIVDRDGRTLFANPAACEMLYRPLEGLVGQPIGIPMAASGHTDLDLLRPDGNNRIVEMRVVEVVWDSQPAYLAALRDITDRKRLEDRLIYLATHDELTDLPNRHLYRDRLEKALVRAIRAGHGKKYHPLVAVMLLDLDNFKKINDTLGHLKGDLVLRAVADRLRSRLRSSDTAARAGGDEFILIYENIADMATCIILANKVQAIFQEPFQLEGQEVAVYASIGISLFPLDGDNLEILIRCADEAMYRAKKARNSYQFYSPLA